MGVPFGTLIANIVFLVCANSMPADDLDAWGWRIPFLISAVLVYIGYIMRSNIDETPEFEAIRSRTAQVKLPFAELVRNHWREVILGAVVTMSGGVAFDLIITFGLTYGTQTLGFSRSTMLTFAMVACALCAILVPIFGKLSDVIGPKRLLALGIVSEGAFAFPMFWLMESKSLLLAMTGFLLMAVAFAANYAPNATYLARLSKSSVRYSGLSVTCMLAGLISSAMSPFVTTALLKITGSGSSVAWYMIFCSVLSLVALFSREKAP
ncbi:MFS transporter [Caballeronia sp. 15711]|uniref:MFS transporter n=1 Tax=Caballeronia sp. 15711 TaxID=3391029 RepID=UPI0039E70824